MKLESVMMLPNVLLITVFSVLNWHRQFTTG